MKKTFTLIIIGMIMISFSQTAEATVWRINNTANVDADFTNPQDAHDDPGVMPGDTLLLEGSPDTYGNLTIYKKLTIIGPGYFLGENTGNQANVSSAMLNSLVLLREPGEAPTVENPAGIDAVSSEGSEVVGVQVGSLTSFVPSITIRRNHVGSIDLSNNNFSGPLSGVTISGSCNNAVIIQNYVTSNISPRIFDNIVINNNILGSVNNTSTGNNITFENNVVTTPGGSAINLYNAVVRNNIVMGTSVIVNNSTYTNNVAIEASVLPTGNDNINSAGVGNVFLALASPSTDGYYQLISGSVAEGVGVGGIDAGAFDGVTPYILSGMPPVPSIYEFSAPAVGSKTDGIDIQVKIKSNN